MDSVDGRKLTEEFNFIWREYYPRLLVFCRMMHAEEPEDTVQDILLKVYCALPEFQQGKSLKSWLYAIARNHIVDERRRAARRSTASITGRTLGIVRPAGDMASVADPSSDVPDDVVAVAVGRPAVESTSEGVACFLETLSASDRAIAYLRMYEAMKYKRISAILEIPEGTVKYRIHEIRSQFKRYRGETR